MKNSLSRLCFVFFLFFTLSALAETSSETIPQKKGWGVILNFLYGQPPFTLEERKKLYAVLQWPKSFEESRTSTDNDSGIKKYNLEDGRFLLQIEGPQYAYQNAYLYYLIDDKQETFTPVKFQVLSIQDKNKVTVQKTTQVAGLPEFKEGKLVVLSHGELVILSKGRGAGGCGTQTTYGFKNGEAYIIEARARSCNEPMDPKHTMANPNNWPLVKFKPVR